VLIALRGLFATDIVKSSPCVEDKAPNEKQGANQQNYYD
jgi:hypothetical protein